LREDNKRRTRLVRATVALWAVLSRALVPFGVDRAHFLAIVALELDLDARPSGERGTGMLSRGLALACVMYLLFGFLMGLGATLEGVDPFWYVTAVTTMTMAFLTMSMVVEFASVLVDRSGVALYGALPVDDRTVLAARVAHIGTFLGLMIGSLVVGPTILGAVAFGPFVWIPFFLASSALASALALFVSVSGYMLALRTVGVQRFKSAVVYSQVAVVGGMYAALYLLRPLVERYGVPDVFAGVHAWCFLFPPAWFGAAFELVRGQTDGLHVALTAVAVVAPIVLLAASLRLARGRFLFGVSASEIAPARAGRERRRIEWLERVLLRSPSQRAGFDFFLHLSTREQGFRMRVWPTTVIIVVMGCGTILQADAAYLLGLPIYVLLVFAPLVLSQMSFTETPEARWLLDASPLDPAGLFAGAIKAVGLVFLVLPAGFLVVILGGMHGMDGVVQGVFALEVVLVGAAATVACLPRALPFTRAFQATSAGSSLVTIVVAMVAVGVFGLAHQLLWSSARPVFHVAVVLLLPAPFFAARVVDRLRIARPSA
jgi:hypothetical protein